MASISGPASATPPDARRGRWALYFREADDRTVGCFELRRNGSKIWWASDEPFPLGHGDPLPPGHGDVRELDNMFEADALWGELVAQHLARGYVLVREAEYTPGTFDFQALEDEIYSGARAAFEHLVASHPNDRICGFALYSDSGGMTLVGAGASEASFPQDTDHDEIRANFNEWPYVTDHGLLIAGRMIAFPAYYLRMEVPFEPEMEDWVERYFETCIRALERLNKEGLFGEGAERDTFLLLFGDSDGSEDFNNMLERLNPAAVAKRYRKFWHRSTDRHLP